MYQYKEEKTANFSPRLVLYPFVSEEHYMAYRLLGRINISKYQHEILTTTVLLLCCELCCSLPMQCRDSFFFFITGAYKCDCTATAWNTVVVVLLNITVILLLLQVLLS